MKKLIALLLVLVLFLPTVTLAEDIDDDWDDDDIEIEPLDPDSYYTDEEGKLIYKIGSVELSEEELKKLEDIEAEIELDSSVTVDEDSLCINPNLPDNVINILLIGVDARGTKEIQLLKDQIRLDENSTGKAISKRSDVIMILSINLDDGSIKLTSIARNTYVEIPGRKNKSIIANSFGYAIYEDGKYKSWIDQPWTCVATVNKNFGLNIQNFVAINFFGVEEIIESLGGVDIDLTQKEARAINTYLSKRKLYNSKGERISHGTTIANTYDNHSEGRKNLKEKKGVQHLDGLQALMYGRLRSIDNDFVRTARTRHLLDSLLKPTMARIKKGELDIVNMIADWSRYFYTQMPLSDIATIASGVLKSLSLSDIESATTMISEFRIPEDKTYSYQTVDGSSVTVMNDQRKTTEALHQFIYGEYYPAD
ncbi:MAG: LCP family protein [Clostridia bacterium]|nr:LCP family protein [Clostridia bacterium]